MSKERTNINCPRCNEKLNKEFWGKNNGGEDYRYTCSACGYNFIQSEEKQDE